MRHYFLLLFLPVLLLSGCGNDRAVLPTITPYRMDIQQGNAVTPKMMMQLRPGMSKSQVRFILGTPLLVDSFHTDHWDYFYQMRKEGKIVEQRRVILEFEGDALKRVRGDVVPAVGDPNAVTVEPLKEPASAKKEEKGLLEKLKFWGDDDKPKASPVPEQKPEPVSAPPAVKEISQPEVGGVAPSARLPEIAPQAISETVPPLMEETPAPPAVVEKKVVPAPVTKPVEPVKPAPAKLAPPEEPRVEIKSKPTPRPVEIKAPPKPGKDLPPEDAPDFFEKMLEKIGF